MRLARTGPAVCLGYCTTVPPKLLFVPRLVLTGKWGRNTVIPHLKHPLIATPPSERDRAQTRNTMLLPGAALSFVALSLVSPRWNTHYSITHHRPNIARISMTDTGPLSDDAVQAKLASIRRGKRRGAGGGPKEIDVAPTKVTEPKQEAGEARTPSPFDPPPIHDSEEAMRSLRAAVTSRIPSRTPIDSAQVMSFLNDHWGAEMLAWVLRETDIGKLAATKNMWSRGSWVPEKVTLDRLEMEGGSLELGFTVTVKERGRQEQNFEQTVLRVQADEACETADSLRAILLQCCGGADTGGVLLRLPGATDDWSLPNDLWLNSTPYPRSVRNMFYADVKEALQAAVADPSCSRKMRLYVAPPHAAAASNPPTRLQRPLPRRLRPPHLPQ